METRMVVDEMYAAIGMLAFMNAAISRVSENGSPLSEKEVVGVQELLFHIERKFSGVLGTLEAQSSEISRIQENHSKPDIPPLRPLQVESAAPVSSTPLRDTAINWLQAWQAACDGVVQAPAGRGFEDHRACYDLAAVLTELGIGMERGE